MKNIITNIIVIITIIIINITKTTIINPIVETFIIIKMLLDRLVLNSFSQP